jgi:ribonucleoside-diphosphate reductase alpha chain
MTKKVAIGKRELSKIPEIRNRRGEVIEFDIHRISHAVYKAFLDTKEGGEDEAIKVSEAVFAELLKLKNLEKIAGEKGAKFIPTVEMIQDTVENELMKLDFLETAKAYIIYRQKRNELREEGVVVPDDLRKLVNDSGKYFRNPLAELVYYRSYSRWIEDKDRRETWIETVDRYMDFMAENLGNKLTKSEYTEVREAILKQEAMPSMRLLQFAGVPARKTNVCAYNCSFIAPECFQDFGEIIYISMCGTGVGFSAESANVQKLPQIKMQNGKKAQKHVVADSKEGWADAFVIGMKTWFEGNDIEFDFSELRPSGARLKTMGGKSSGPQPLIDLIAFTKERILRKQGRRLSNLDVHDIVCKIGECVVSGGVRRSALISLSDLDDELIRDAKMGAFWNTDPQRMLANNSAVYNTKPSVEEFMGEWLALIKSGSGERGIFNKGCLPKQLPKRRVDILTKDGYIDDFGRVVGSIGVNPCGEIILRSKQFCNLSEVVARSEDTEASLMKKIRIATILGTYQSSLTNFQYLSKEWTDNCKRERLLGVSITGQWDSKVARAPKILQKLRAETIRINKLYAKRFGISESTAITCVKPSGNLSQTVDSASGMHPRHSQYYIRRVRISANDSLFKMMKDQGVPHYPEVGQSYENAHTFVLEFPVAAPKGAIFKDDVTALDQLEHWKNVKVNFTEHNPSVTISVGDDEWLTVASWLYQNWDIIGGLSFLPRSNHVYQLAPYEAIDEKTYKELTKTVANIDFSKLVTYERRDETEVQKELACVAGNCEI